MKYRASRDLPKFARENHTLSPTDLARIILEKRNKTVSPEAITMWFKRHPDILMEIKGSIHAEELPQAEVSKTIFNNGTFEELRTVKQWLIQLDARELSREFIKTKINLLKAVCKGQIRGFDLVFEGLWCLKHPDRLTLQECMEIISIVRRKGKDTYQLKRDLKDFMQSKGIPVGQRIAVGKPRGYGKFARLFVKKPVLKAMLEWIKKEHFEVYVVDAFMYKTGTRITATLNALLENIGETGDQAIITVYDKGRKSKYPHGHPWDKRLDATLLWDIKQLIGLRRHGKIFTVSKDLISKINRQALETFAPEILKQFPTLMVNHFWRHMFFQHMLRNCDWNYTVAAALGGSESKSVEESYGKPPEETIKKWAEIHFITI